MLLPREETRGRGKHGQGEGTKDHPEGRTACLGAGGSLGGKVPGCQ